MRTALLVAALSVAGVATLVPSPAQAQIETSVSSRRVEVGEPFQLQLSASADSGSPGNPRLAAPAGISVQGPSMGTQTQMTFSNGRMSRSTRITATWTLIASKPGTYRVGPPSIEIGGKVQQGQVAAVEVLPRGSTPRRRSPFGQFPFDLFDFPDPLGGRPLPGLPDPNAFDQPSHPPEFAIEEALDPTAFVVTRVTPARVVLGEAVRVDILAYGARGDFHSEPSTEPSREGFLAYDVNENPRTFRLPIGDSLFTAKRVNALILFPIQTGTLKIGASRFEFKGGAYDNRTGNGITRESAPVQVIVTEPPLEGRPPGYRLGDVGKYELKASVEPRTVTEGGAVAVTVKLEGTGNVPASLPLPGQKGVEWSAPTTSEHLEAAEGKVQGYRTFAYVVKLDRPGEIDLGELALSFYDPEKRRYATTRARLGKVTVRPDPQAKEKQAAAEPSDVLRELLPPRTSFGAGSVRPSYLADRPFFWVALALGPLSVLAVSGAAQGGRRWYERRRQRRDLPEERAGRELERAREARGRDPVQACGAAERAVVLAIESATGLKARGVLRSELASELTKRGVREELSKQVVELLDQCENVRFSGALAEAADHAVELSERIVPAFSRGKWKS